MNKNGELSVEEGAKTSVELATLPVTDIPANLSISARNCPGDLAAKKIGGPESPPISAGLRNLVKVHQSILAAATFR
jgi:hypothetical protein